MFKYLYISVIIVSIYLIVLSCNTPNPVACIGANIQPGIISLKDTLVMDAGCSDNAREYSWDFGDGTIINESIASHRYQKEGVFKIHLTVTNKTKIDEASLTYSVQK